MAYTVSEDPREHARRLKAEFDEAERRREVAREVIWMIHQTREDFARGVAETVERIESHDKAARRRLLAEHPEAVKASLDAVIERTA